MPLVALMGASVNRSYVSMIVIPSAAIARMTGFSPNRTGGLHNVVHRGADESEQSSQIDSKEARISIDRNPRKAAPTPVMVSPSTTTGPGVPVLRPVAVNVVVVPPPGSDVISAARAEAQGTTLSINRFAFHVLLFFEG